MPEENEQSNAVDLLDGPPATEKETLPTEESEHAAPAGIDYKALAAANAEAFAAAGFKPPVAEQKSLTPEEAKKLLNVWEPDDAFIQKFGNMETQKVAIAEMRDALIRQADTIAQLRLQEMQQKYEEQFAPVRQFVSEQQAQQRETRFNSMFPELAKPELRPLLSSVVQGLVAQGALSERDEAKNFKTIGAAMEAVIKQANPNFKLSGGSNPPGKTRNGNALPVTTSGSGGGGGGKGKSDDGKALALKFL